MRFLVVCILFLAAVSAVPSEREKRSSGSCKCGWTNRNRIVGGRETMRNEFPSMVQIENTFGGHVCGGSIITPWHVLTAAHCTRQWGPKHLLLSVGGHARSGPSEGRIRVARVIDHERYDHSIYLNDISLLLTASEIRFTQNVGPVCMPNRRLNLVGQRVRALGWGDTTDGGRLADRLQFVDLTVISHQRCSDHWKAFRIKPVEANNMCTLETRRDTCQGDSGGPLHHTDPQTNRQVLAALVSFGLECAGGVPAVNTDVSAYIDWINRNVASSRSGTQACRA